MIILAAVLLFLVFWWRCGVFSYRRMRTYYRRKGWKWTYADRRDGLFSSMFGPVSVLAAVMAYETEDEEKEVSW